MSCLNTKLTPLEDQMTFMLTFHVWSLGDKKTRNQHRCPSGVYPTVHGSRHPTAIPVNGDRIASVQALTYSG